MTNVYVTGRLAKRYHTSLDCRYVRKVIPEDIPLHKAEERGLTECKYCSGQKQAGHGPKSELEAKLETHE